ncbi:hypothetical protein [Streptomyces sp. NPDC021020]|uniref:hypothetical protein n=1 Tax=Streptomyces sp. NPDC021020 TaxID=3365109 RepID=UPI0037A85ED7
MSGRHAAPGPTAARRAGVASLLAAGLLAAGGGWTSASAAQGGTAPGTDTGAKSAPAAPPCCRDDDEPAQPEQVHGDNHGLLIIDNSNADSWLEVDRTLNTMLRSKGTAGSDHDGDGGDVDVTHAPAAGTAPQPASPPEEPEGDD